MPVPMDRYQRGRRIILEAINPAVSAGWLVLKSEPKMPMITGMVVDGAYFYEPIAGAVLRAQIAWGNKNYDDSVRAIIVTRPCSALSLIGDRRDTGTIEAILLTSFILTRE